MADRWGAGGDAAFDEQVGCAADQAWVCRVVARAARQGNRVHAVARGDAATGTAPVHELRRPTVCGNLHGHVGAAARPQGGRPAAGALHGDDGGVIVAVEGGVLEAGQVACGDLVRGERRAAAAVYPHQAERLRIGGVGGGIRHFVDGDPLRTGRQGHRKALDDVIGLILLRDIELWLGYRPRGIVRGCGVGFGNPQRLIDTVLSQQVQVEAAEPIDGVGVEVDVQRDRVEVVVVRAGHRIGGKNLEVAVEEEITSVVGVPPVGHGGKVDDHVWIDLMGDVVGHFHQLDEVLDRTAPRLEIGVPDVGFVPDNPVLDAPGVARHQCADEGCPRVSGLVVG